MPSITLALGITLLPGYLDRRTQDALLAAIRAVIAAASRAAEGGKVAARQPAQPLSSDVRRRGGFRLFLPQCPAYALRFAKRISNTVVRRSLVKKDHGLATRALPRITVLKPARPIPEFRFALGTADLN